MYYLLKSFNDISTGSYVFLLFKHSNGNTNHNSFEVLKRTRTSFQNLYYTRKLVIKFKYLSQTILNHSSIIYLNFFINVLIINCLYFKYNFCLFFSFWTKYLNYNHSEKKKLFWMIFLIALHIYCALIALEQFYIFKYYIQDKKTLTFFYFFLYL